MIHLASYGGKLNNLFHETYLLASSLGKKFQDFWNGACLLIFCCYHDLIFRINPFFLQVFYFLSVSSIGFGILQALKPRSNDFKPRNLDLFFTSVSAMTVSSMSTVEMEVFSNVQLVVITFLMFVGGEVFTSMVGLHLRRSKIMRMWKSEGRVTSVESNTSNSSSPNDSFNQIELTIVTVPETDFVAQLNPPLNSLTFLMFVGGEVFTSMVGLHLRRSKIMGMWKSEGRVTSVESNTSNSSSPNDSFNQIELTIVTVPETGFVAQLNPPLNSKPFIKYDSIRFLGFIVLGYLYIVQILGVILVLIYLALNSEAKDVLRKKGLETFTFAMFTVVSTFTNCGFVPTNENMMVFGKNSGLLLILIPQILLGNTLFPSALRFLIWVSGKKFKKEEAKYLLKHTLDIGYKHLLPGLHSLLLMATVSGFILIGFLLLCAIEWNSAVFGELNSYQKVIGAFFQSINARHTGETIVDLSAIAPAISMFFIIMMYLPPYTSFLPVKKGEEIPTDEVRRRRVGENFILSQLSYLAFFVILLCITERKSIKHDPINFSIFNIAFEVISAYGNVGFTTGYSCGRQLTPDSTCVDKWYGFAGKWSDEGKLILIVVMFFGRLKKFNMNGGRAWKLL